MNEFEKFVNCDPAFFSGSVSKPETPFEKEGESYRISILNKVLNKEAFLLEDFDRLAAFKICGGGYRRTGLKYPAIVLLSTFFDEGCKSDFVEELCEMYDSSMDDMFSYLGDEDMTGVSQEKAIDLAYLASAIIDLVENKSDKDDLRSIIFSAKAFMEDIPYKGLVAVKL